MEALLFIFDVLVVLGLIFCVWGLICNNKTHTQRRWIIQQIFRRRDWEVQQTVLDRVTYHNHLTALMLFQDPFRLYKNAGLEL